MAQPTEAQRLAFAKGLAWLLLRHVKDLTPKGRKLIEAVRDAKTMDEMRAAAAAYTICTSASASASAAFAAAFAYVAAYAQKYAVKAGVPEHEVAALRMIIFGE